MKKSLRWFVFLMVGMFFFSCSNSNLSQWMEENGKLKILSTTAMIGDLVTEVGKDEIDSFVLIQGEMDPHSYELVKGDNEKLMRADCIFYNGLGLEHGASLSYFLSHNDKSVAIGDQIREKIPQKIIVNSGVVDPHIWMDASIWVEAVDLIVEKLSSIKPEKQQVFFQNGEELKKKLIDTHLEVLSIIQSIPNEKRYLITSHDAFHYFARAYLSSENEGDGMNRVAAPEGLAPDGAISPMDLKNILLFLSKYKVTVVFPESNVSKASLEKIVSDASTMGIDVIIAKDVLYGDAMPKAEKNEISYLKMLHHNATLIAEYCHGKK